MLFTIAYGMLGLAASVFGFGVIKEAVDNARNHLRNEHNDEEDNIDTD